MEVHPPDHPIHTWRDFFIHIATIVIGLLIAIGLEQTVEWFHHRHLVHMAHLDLRTEAAGNREQARSDRQILDHVHAAVLQDLGTLRRLQKNPHAPGARLTVHWSWNDLKDSAYNTARDTGAFALMPYEEVQDIDSVYTQQHYVEGALQPYILSVSRIYQPLLGGRTLDDLSPAEIDTTIESCSAALVNIELLQQLMRSLDEDYAAIEAE